jgi:alpha-tubulin suppressor-like RCC1 family protein
MMRNRMQVWLAALLVLTLVGAVGQWTTAATAAAPQGTISAWGRDLEGQLGDDAALVIKPTPVPVAGLTGMVALAAGYTHSLALKADGTVWAWGDDQFGQLGDDAVLANKPTPVQVAGLTGVSAIAAGFGHSLALKTDGTVLAWGEDNSGQLGDGTVGSPDNNPTPKQVPGVTGVVAIAAGASQSLALKGDGTLLAWGADSQGQLGDGMISSPEFNPTPKAVPGVSGVVAIATGTSHSLALKSDGTLLAWGADFDGQLGDGTLGVPASNPTPTLLPGVSGVIAIAAGAFHSLALKGDGTVLTWGDDTYGELGDGTVKNPDRDPAPKAATGVNGIVAVAAGAYYSLALKGNGTVFAWGDDVFGQRGDGTRGDPNENPTPAAVPGVSGVIAIAAGGEHALALVGAASSPTFGDVPPGDPAADAIAQLAARGIINGCDATATPPLFCPNDFTLRAQMAALIVRAIPGWSAETYPNTFTDQGQVDDELWRRVATLQHYGVANGYNDCPAQGKVVPCYGPTDPVLRAQAISFVTRALVKKGYWTDQPDDPTLYGGALAGTGHEQDAATYWHYTEAKGGVPDYPKGGSFPTFEAAPRAWFARLLWTALQDTPAAQP